MGAAEDGRAPTEEHSCVKGWRPRWIFVHTQIVSSKRGNVAGLFMIDTGFMGALLLHRPFVQQNELLPPENESTPFELCGIGGGSSTRMAQLESLRLGSVEIGSPVTMFSQAKEGNLVSTDYDGLIGCDLTTIQFGVRLFAKPNDR